MLDKSAHTHSFDPNKQQAYLLTATSFHATLLFSRLKRRIFPWMFFFLLWVAAFLPPSDASPLKGEVASRILERQRLRLEGKGGEASGTESPTAATAGRRRRRGGGGGSLRPGGELGHGAAWEEEEEDDDDCDDEAEGREGAPGSNGETLLARAGSGGGDQEVVPGDAGVRGRTRLRSSGGGAGALTASTRTTSPGGIGGVVRCRSSPAGASRGLNAARDVVRSSSGRAAGRREASGGGVAGAMAAEARQGDGGCRTDSSRGLQHKQLHADDAHGRARPNGRSSNSHTATRHSSSTAPNGGRSSDTHAPTAARHSTTTPTGGGAAAAAAGDGTSMLTMQTCFRQERESFIRDLQVLHRQLDAKDRDHARRDAESQAAFSRARAEARAARERAASLRKEAEAAAAARAVAEARVGVAAEELDRWVAATTLFLLLTLRTLAVCIMQMCGKQRSVWNEPIRTC